MALSGAHTLGRAWKERSGASPHGAGDGGATAYTRGDARARGPTAPPGVGLPGGQSWTRHWLLFDNSYFSALLAPAGARDPLLLRLETDDALASDPGFAPHARRYAADQATFFADYAAAHAKLAELGSAFAPAGGVAID